MEKYVDIKSPFTGGRVKEVTTTETKVFRHVQYEVPVSYYVCEDTGEQFTTSEQDQAMLDALYSQYRAMYGIPSPAEITAIRKQYRLNYTQMAKLLGFGINQYAQYEKGEMPSESNGKMIMLAAIPQAMKCLLQGCRGLFSEAEYNKIMVHISEREASLRLYAPQLSTQSTKSSLYQA